MRYKKGGGPDVSERYKRALGVLRSAIKRAGPEISGNYKRGRAGVFRTISLRRPSLGNIRSM